MCRELLLSRGLVALVDDDDYLLVADSNWFASPYRGGFYAKRMSRTPEGKRTTEYLHRVLLPDVPRVDHINGDGLDNRRVNLRPATHAQNLANSRLSNANTSGYKGVTWHKKTGKWHACLWHDGRKISGRYHDTPEEAAIAYDHLLRLYVGEFGRYNCPRPGERGVRHA